ncbi:hypothetical protein [Pedobacter insulae]|nr:hypothetical protein [Pedobacter insulae]
MEINPDLQLSSELQELYLENKEWRSQIDFLKDEYRFFTKLFAADKLAAMKHAPEKVEMMGNSLDLLHQKIKDLESLTSEHQHLIESILTEPKQHIGFELIEQNASIGTKIKFLFESDRAIKKDLFELVEGIKL